MTDIRKESLLVTSFKFIAGAYRRHVSIYSDSRTSLIFNNFGKEIADYFRYSFLERVSRIEGEKSNFILKNSKFTAKVVGVYMAVIRIFFKLIKNSEAGSSLTGLKEDFYKFTLRISGVILIVFVFTNIFFSALFNKHITHYGWIIRVMLLFLGVCGLSSNADWSSIKNNSLIFKKFLK